MERQRERKREDRGKNWQKKREKKRGREGRRKEPRGKKEEKKRAIKHEIGERLWHNGDTSSKAKNGCVHQPQNRVTTRDSWPLGQLGGIQG